MRAKEKAGSIATPRPKARHFQKEYNNPRWRSTRHHPERIQYAQDTIHPWPSRAVASNCLILVAEIVEIPDRGTRAKLSEFTPVHHLSSFFQETKKGVELNASTLSEALDCPQRINANNSRPKRSCGINKNEFAM